MLENAIYFTPLLLIVYHAFALAVAVPVAVVRYLLSTCVHYCTHLTLVAPLSCASRTCRIAGGQVDTGISIFARNLYYATSMHLAKLHSTYIEQETL
jgi:hypothetical protein